MTKIGRNNIVLNSLNVMSYCEVNKGIYVYLNFYSTEATETTGVV